jgi:hypothetical protein
MLPSRPAPIPDKPLCAGMPAENCVTVPDGVIRATHPRLGSVNHMLPSGPAAIWSGPLCGGMPAENRVTLPDGVIRPSGLPRSR